MKIYTKTGDRGQTGLVGGSRIPKTSARIDAIGDVDELNAALGVAAALPAEGCLFEEIRAVQHWLFDLGSELACPPDGRIQYATLSEKQIETLERQIDQMTEEMPALAHFILPGGSPLAAALHSARSVCRRAERSVLELHAEEPLREAVLQFLNRLADWLFVAARYANHRLHIADVKWESSN